MSRLPSLQYLAYRSNMGGYRFLNSAAIPFPMTPTVLTVFTSVCAGDSKRLEVTYFSIVQGAVGGVGSVWSLGEGRATAGTPSRPAPEAGAALALRSFLLRKASWRRRSSTFLAGSLSGSFAREESKLAFLGLKGGGRQAGRGRGNAIEQIDDRFGESSWQERDVH